MSKRAVLLFPEKEEYLIEDFLWFLGQETDLNFLRRERQIVVFDGDSIIKIPIFFDNRIIRRLNWRGIGFSQLENEDKNYS